MCSSFSPTLTYHKVLSYDPFDHGGTDILCNVLYKYTHIINISISIFHVAIQYPLSSNIAVSQLYIIFVCYNCDNVFLRYHKPWVYIGVGGN